MILKNIGSFEVDIGGKVLKIGESLEVEKVSHAVQGLVDGKMLSLEAPAEEPAVVEVKKPRK